nr:hypothetical protein HmN_000668100 [Hymenolepis microstoma]
MCHGVENCSRDCDVVLSRWNYHSCSKLAQRMSEQLIIGIWIFYRGLLTALITTSSLSLNEACATNNLNECQGDRLFSLEKSKKFT